MSLQNISAIGLAGCLLIVCCAYYLEQQYMLAACPLCMLQRYTFIILCLMFAIGTTVKLRGIGRYVYCCLIGLFSALGTAIAGRQFWLQYYAPPQKISCAASLEHLIEIYPILEALKISLAGSAECASIDYTIMGLSLAAWSLLAFVIILLTSFYIFLLIKTRRI